jgi:hypothetical protein
MSQTQVQNELWRRGILRFKLHPLQKKIYEEYYQNTEDYFTTMLISRQTGKSFLLAILAVETCIRTPDAVVKFVTPKLRMIKNILNKNMKQILKDCPPDIKPEWKENDKVWKFPNGSEIQAAGTDNKHYDSIRGGTCSLWVVDEACFCDDLEDVVYSVLTPTTTMTKGRGLLSSTPDPNDPEHPFIKVFVEKAKQENKLYKYTLHDNPMLTKDQINEIISRYPDKTKNIRFRAEYLCEVVRDKTKTIIPEFDDVAESEIVTDKFLIPTYYDYYLSMDIGGKDFTSILIAYYDFINDTVVIIDEIVHKDKQSSKKIAKSIKDKLAEHFDEKPPYLMFADNNNIILLNDLRADHKLSFIPTQKDNKQAAINKVKILIANRQIIIHPRCVNLIRQLRTGRWSSSNKNGYKDFAKDPMGGHFDLIDALIYLIRNIIYGKNPYPKGYHSFGGENHHIQKQQIPENSSVFSRLFKNRSSLKINK